MVTLGKNEASLHHVNQFADLGRVPDPTANRCAHTNCTTDRRPTDHGANACAANGSGGHTHHSADDCANRRADAGSNHSSDYHVNNYADACANTGAVHGSDYHAYCSANYSSACAERRGRER